MPNISIPDILTDLSHVGAAGLPRGGAPVILQELEICRHWGFLIEQENDRVFLRFDEDQIVPYWIQRETPDLAWDGLRVNGFLLRWERQSVIQNMYVIPLRLKEIKMAGKQK